MDKKFTAWMIREDGVDIPCVQHIYGSTDCFEETLYASEWLYKNTIKDDARNMALRFISAYAESLSPERDLSENLLKFINTKPYVTVTEEFVRQTAPLLSASDGKEDLFFLNRKVCDALNREFLRVRLGGKYISEAGCKDIYFRISGMDHDWGEVINRFLKEHAEQISTVTILYDEESTGHKEFLQNKTGKAIDHTLLQNFDVENMVWIDENFECNSETGV